MQPRYDREPQRSLLQKSTSGGFDPISRHFRHSTLAQVLTTLHSHKMEFEPKIRKLHMHM